MNFGNYLKKHQKLLRCAQFYRSESLRDGFVPAALSLTDAMNPSKKTFTTVSDGLKIILFSGAAIWLFTYGARNLNYNWQWYRVEKYLFSFHLGHLEAGPLLTGLLVTLKISAIGLVLSTAIGLVAALMRMSASPTARVLSRCYLEIIRNTPLLVQLFFIYFVLAPILDFERFTAAILSLSLFEGAYASEIFRAGIVAIAREQWEGAFSLGLGRWQVYRLVILPQAIRKMLPPLTGQAVSLVKDSALVSTIAIYDLTMRGQEIIAETYLVFEIWFTVAILYLLLTVSLSTFAAAMEKHFTIKT
jgi:polar amino acid transport system permease protein